jgi:hypothetical protein
MTRSRVGWVWAKVDYTELWMAVLVTVHERDYISYNTFYTLILNVLMSTHTDKIWRHDVRAEARGTSALLQPLWSPPHCWISGRHRQSLFRTERIHGHLQELYLWARI